MPFDATPTETKPDVFSVQGLIAWLETQDPATNYDWEDCRGGCLVGIYYAANEVPRGTDYTKIFGANWITDYGKVCSSLSGPTTFGAALDRARKLLAGARD